jgi:nucleoid-associated protein YgaU
MDRRKTVGLALGVLAAGICAALPFRRTDVNIAPIASPAAGELVLNQPANVVMEPGPAALETPPQEPPRQEEPRNKESPQSSVVGAGGLETAPAPGTTAAASPVVEVETSKAVVHPATPDNTPPTPRYTTWRRHRIRDGDTLAKLAQTYLGDAAREGEIFALNRDVLADPNLLPIGRWLRIPPEDRSAAELSSDD